MDYEKLKSAAETITLPDKMKHHIIGNCKTQLSNSGKETIMNKTFIRKPVAIIAAVALCLSMSVVALAATGVLQGFFSDITNQQGAVVGTSYEQATDEIRMNVTVNSDELNVLATFTDPQIAPYVYAEQLGIAQYRIVDENGNVIKDGAAESAEVVNGQATINIQLDNIDSGSYTLNVTAFVSEKKADQPLNINGSWECTFTK